VSRGTGGFCERGKIAHELYDAIKALRIDPSNVYRVAPSNHIQLRRGDAVFSFEEGAFAFFSPLDGQITGVVFLGAAIFWRLPRTGRKAADGRFLGAPVLDQEFINGYLRFTDDTAGELLRQFQAANLPVQTDTSVGVRWDAAVTQLNPGYTLRILYDRLSSNPKPAFTPKWKARSPAVRCVLDTQRDEQFFLGQVHKAGDVFLHDVWTSHRVPGTSHLQWPFMHCTTH